MEKTEKGELCVPCFTCLSVAMLLKVVAKSCEGDEQDLMNEVWRNMQEHLGVEREYIN